MLIVVLVGIGAAVVLRSHRPKGVEVLGPVALPGLLGLVLIPVIARGGICSSLFRTPGGLVVEVERCFACCAVGVIAQREDRAGVVTDEGGSRIVSVGVVVRYIPPAPTRTGSSCGASLLAKTPPKTRAATISARHSPAPRIVARAFTDNLVVRWILRTSTSTTKKRTACSIRLQTPIA